MKEPRLTVKPSFLKRMFRQIFPRRNLTPNIGMLGDGDEIEMFEDLESEFDMRFDDLFCQNVRTVGDLYGYLVGKRPDISSEVIWERLCAVLEAYGNKMSKEIRKEMSFFDYNYD